MADICCVNHRDLLNSVMLTVTESAAEIKMAATAVRDVVEQGSETTEKQLSQQLQQSTYSIIILRNGSVGLHPIRLCLRALQNRYCSLLDPCFFGFLTRFVAIMTTVVIVPMGRWRPAVTTAVAVQVVAVLTCRWRSTIHSRRSGCRRFDVSLAIK